MPPDEIVQEEDETEEHISEPAGAVGPKKGSFIVNATLKNAQSIKPPFIKDILDVCRILE